MGVSLRLTGAQYEELRSHLFPGDGLEAVALLVCGRRAGDEKQVLTTCRVVPVPYDECSVRQQDKVVWSTAVLDRLLPEVWKSGWSLVKVHSHPGYCEEFSRLDDESDGALAMSWECLFEEGRLHGSAVMLPDGRIFGRNLQNGLIAESFDSVLVGGDDIRFWNYAEPDDAGLATQRRHEQAFGKGTIRKLRGLRVAVIGCSGTGSIVIEQLARLGVGSFVLVDPDVTEDKNINRILNSTAEDAQAALPKVLLLARMIESLGQEQSVLPLQANLDSPDVVKAVAECDVAFGCVDTAEGRNLLSRLCAFYLVPYIDVGVTLVADGEGGVETIAGAVHYLKPGGSTLLERGAYTMEQVRAEETKRTNPEAFEELRRANYIQGVDEDRPAVVTVNMFFSSLAVNEFLARIHCFRNMSNADCSITRGDLCEWAIFKEEAPAPGGHLQRELGRGDQVPLLGRPSLSEVL
jgi:hypothetical protein